MSIFSKSKKRKPTVGKCCECGTSLDRQPAGKDKLDGVARFCTKCGTDICVHCLQKLTLMGSGERECPVCGESAWFEINPLSRP